MPLSLDGNGPIGGITTQNGGQLAGMRNRIINGQFNTNQRVVSGTVTLTAGSYGHDRFKAGAGGCTYTFAASANGNILTISAGTLMQVIEGVNLEGGTFVLSWFGTATGRIDSGSYSASGVTGTATAGTNQTVEFGTGTCGRVQYELGTVATTFEQRPIGMELGLCQRYHQGGGTTAASISAAGVFYIIFYSGISYSVNATIRAQLPVKATMRTTPTVMFCDGSGNIGKVYFNGPNAAVSIFSSSPDSVSCLVTCTATASLIDLNIQYALDAEL